MVNIEEELNFYCNTPFVCHIVCVSHNYKYARRNVDFSESRASNSSRYSL